MRLGIIGCGEISRAMALMAKLNRRIQIAACADRDEDRARRFAARFGIGAWRTDYRELLDRSLVDAVYVALPHHLHRQAICDAAERGLPVLCEKPIAESVGAGDEAVRFAAERGIKLAVNYQYRYDSGCYALRAAARRGDLGRLFYGRCNIPWRRDAGYFSGSPWHARRELAGGGTLITQGSHSLDILLWTFDADVERVHGTVRSFVHGREAGVDVEDFACGVLELQGGQVVEVTSSMASFPERPVSIEAYGERGTAVYTGPDWPHLRFYGTRPKRERPPTRGVHALARSLEGFRRWVEHDIPHLCTGSDALRVLAAVGAIYREAGSDE